MTKDHIDPTPNPQPTDAEILAWQERNCGPYYSVRQDRIGTRYEVHIRWVDGQTVGPWMGPTLREAFIEAMKHYDRRSLPEIDLMNPKPQVRMVPLDEPTGIVDTMDNALILDAKYLPKEGGPDEPA